MTAEEKPKGCLLLNVLLELSTIDDAAGERVRGHLSGIQDAIRDALKNAQGAGELSAGKKVHEAAVFLMGSIFSLRVMGRARATREDLRHHTAAVAGTRVCVAGSGRKDDLVGVIFLEDACAKA